MLEVVAPIGNVQTPVTGVKMLVKWSRPVFESGQAVNIEILGQDPYYKGSKIAPKRGVVNFCTWLMLVKVKGQDIIFC